MGETLTFTDAAERVLREESNGRPMHYTDIVSIAIENGYLHTKGQTPERTLSAQIGTQNRRRKARGEDPKFTVHGNGYYSLAVPSRGIERDVEKHNELTRKRLRDALYEIEPDEFEYLIARLLSEIGYEDIEITSYGGDRGIDINSLLTVGGVTRVKTAVQVKRHKKNIGSPTVRELRGSLGAHHRGLIITTSDFTAGAYEEAIQSDRTPISLVNGDHLVELLVEYGIGVTRKDVAILALDREALEGAPEVPQIEGDEPKAGEEEDVAKPARTKPTKGDGRVASIWPLPGGSHKYADTLFRLLAMIVQGNPTQEDVAEWFLREFPNVRGKRSTRGYLQVLRGMGLVKYEGEEILVTSAGAELAASESLDDLRRVLEMRILGMTEIQELLQKGPATVGEVHQFLLDRLELSWTTTAQTEWRLNWLECVGVIEKKGDKYHIVPRDQ